MLFPDPLPVFGEEPSSRGSGLDDLTRIDLANSLDGNAFRFCTLGIKLTAFRIHLIDKSGDIGRRGAARDGIAIISLADLPGRARPIEQTRRRLRLRVP